MVSASARRRSTSGRRSRASQPASASGRPDNTAFKRSVPFLATERRSWRAGERNVQIPNLLPQRIPVQAENIGRFQLVAARRCERAQDQRTLDLAQEPVVNPWRRKAAGVRAEVALEV